MSKYDAIPDELKERDQCKCPTCGQEFKRVTTHWNQSDCPYPSVSAEQWEIITGILMGDGWFDSTNGIFGVDNTNLRFLVWLDGFLDILSTGVYKVKKAGERTATIAGHEVTNRKPQYRVKTKQIPEFKKLSRWYDQNGDKRYPSDLELTPHLTKMWYVSDGCYNKKDGESPVVQIGCHNEAGRVGSLKSLFHEVGFEPSWWGDRLGFGYEESERLLNWMGEPPAGFEYKWGHQ